MIGIADVQRIVAEALERSPLATRVRQLQGFVTEGSGAPTATAQLGTLYLDRTNGNLYVNESSGWVLK